MLKNMVINMNEYLTNIVDLEIFPPNTIHNHIKIRPGKVDRPEN